MGLGVEGGDFVGEFDDSDLKKVIAWHNLKSRWGDDRDQGGGNVNSYLLF